MRKLISNIIFKFIILINNISTLIFNRSIKETVYELLRESSYTKVNINGSNITFFTPSSISHWRAKTIFSKEKETISWINSFTIKEKDIFWDIGANVGIYSIYAATKYPLISVVSFEPSFSNLSLLSRNININKFEEKIDIVQLPLSNDEKYFQFFNEASLLEGAGVNAFEDKISMPIREVVSKTRVMGTSIDALIKNKILKCPKYIKMDVDNAELSILEGMSQTVLNDKYLESILIELNEFNKEDFDKCIRIFEEKRFSLKEKSRSYEPQDEKLKGTYNFIFNRA